MAEQDTPLESVPSIPRGVIQKLAARWITSVEQFVSIGGSDANVKALASELGIAESEVRSLVGSARAALDPSAAAALERPVDTSKYPLGARNPRTSPPDRDT